MNKLYRFLIVIFNITLLITAGCYSTDDDDMIVSQPILRRIIDNPSPPDAASPVTLEQFELVVPQSRVRKDLRAITLRVWRFRPTQAPQQLPPLIYLSGGPGGNSFHNGLEKRGKSRASFFQRDVIFFSQRGSFGAKPFLQCKNYFSTCAESWAIQGFDWNTFNTIENAHDVADLIKSFGYEKAIIYGGSYGSRLAQQVLHRYPELTHAVVLTGVDYPYKKLFVEADFQMPETFEHSFSFYKAACEANPSCVEKFPSFDPRHDFFTARDKAPNLAKFERQYKNFLNFDVEEAAAGIKLAYYTARDLHDDRPQNDPNPWGDPTYAMGMMAAMRYFDHYQFYRDKTIDKRLTNFYPTSLQQKFVSLEKASLKRIMQSKVLMYNGTSPIHDYDRKEFKLKITSDVPVLIEQGLLDFRTPAKHAREVSENLRHSQYIESPCSGHQFFLQSHGCGLAILKTFMEHPDSKIDASSCIAQICKNRADKFVDEMLKN